MTLTRSLEPAAAIRRIETDRADLLAVDVSGEANASDAENLYGLLEGAYALHPKIDVLIRMSDLKAASGENLSEETVADGRERAATRIRALALVAAPDWAQSAAAELASAAGIEVQSFGPDDEGQAWRWLGARRIDGG